MSLGFFVKLLCLLRLGGVPEASLLPTFPLHLHFVKSTATSTRFPISNNKHILSICSWSVEK
jgi:hypothetical protein